MVTLREGLPSLSSAVRRQCYPDPAVTVHDETMSWVACCVSVIITMSDDEDEELAMLRLQALMSKRRSGSAASKAVPFPVSLSLAPVKHSPPPVATDVTVTSLPTVVTSAPAAVSDIAHGVDNSAGMYQQPRYVRGQASSIILVKTFM